MKNTIEICDCTLRDGGYYTNWDFDKDLIESYFKVMEGIPSISYIEIGYRNNPKDEYFGEFFYCPEYMLKKAKSFCPSKKIAIMLNEKDISINDVDSLLLPYEKYIDLIRIAVNPDYLSRALDFGTVLKKRGFKVAFNLMYMSKWGSDESFIDSLTKLEGIVDYLYMVDSFGGIYPADVKNVLDALSQKVSIPIGFHGHNNLELGLANTLAAIEGGAKIVDSTITGMGRGAGNLKTELLLTVLQSKNLIYFDFNRLSPLVKKFEEMQRKYRWGTSLPYMISGAYSLPQKDVMSWISKRRYTADSIINALQNRKNKISDNLNVPLLKYDKNVQKAVVIGGGVSVLRHYEALNIYCSQHPEVVLVHAGCRYVEYFNKNSNQQFYCLLGAEGNKLNNSLGKINLERVKCVIEPSPRQMGTILPDEIRDISFELEVIDFIDSYPDSLFTIALQVCFGMNVEEIMLFGFDGYDLKTEEQMIEVAEENQYLINSIQEAGVKLSSFTPTKYRGISSFSIYSKI